VTEEDFVERCKTRLGGREIQRAPPHEPVHGPCGLAQGLRGSRKHPNIDFTMFLIFFNFKHSEPDFISGWPPFFFVRIQDHGSQPWISPLYISSSTHILILQSFWLATTILPRKSQCLLFVPQSLRNIKQSAVKSFRSRKGAKITRQRDIPESPDAPIVMVLTSPGCSVTSTGTTL